MMLKSLQLRIHLRKRGLRSLDHMIVSCGRAHFLLYSLSGKIVGYQRYNPWGSKKPHSNSLGDDAKYYTYTSKGEIHFWGAQHYDIKSPVLFLTEGVFNAIKVVNEGYPCFAMLTSSPSECASNFLNMLPQTLVKLMDNDGEAKGAFRKVRGYKEYPPSQYGDVGDMPQREARVMINNILEKYNINEKRMGYPDDRRKVTARIPRE